MAIELRKTGINVVGDLPWGAHFCYFYETKQDLLDILIPYFKTGLENKEFCLWVISNSELLTVEEAMSSLRNALPDLDRYVTERSIEVVGQRAKMQRPFVTIEDDLRRGTDPAIAARKK
jgi:hypothetical protein